MVVGCGEESPCDVGHGGINWWDNDAESLLGDWELMILIAYIVHDEVCCRYHECGDVTGITD